MHARPPSPATASRGPALAPAPPPCIPALIQPAQRRRRPPHAAPARRRPPPRAWLWGIDLAPSPRCAGRLGANPGRIRGESGANPGVERVHAEVMAHGMHARARPCGPAAPRCPPAAAAPCAWMTKNGQSSKSQKKTKNKSAVAFPWGSPPSGWLEGGLQKLAMTLRHCCQAQPALWPPHFTASALSKIQDTFHERSARIFFKFKIYFTSYSTCRGLRVRAHGWQPWPCAASASDGECSLRRLADVCSPQR